MRKLSLLIVAALLPFVLFPSPAVAQDSVRVYTLSDGTKVVGEVIIDSGTHIMVKDSQTGESRTFERAQVVSESSDPDDIAAFRHGAAPVPTLTLNGIIFPSDGLVWATATLSEHTGDYIVCLQRQLASPGRLGAIEPAEYDALTADVFVDTTGSGSDSAYEDSLNILCREVVPLWRFIVSDDGDLVVFEPYRLIDASVADPETPPVNLESDYYLWLRLTSPDRTMPENGLIEGRPVTARFALRKVATSLRQEHLTAEIAQRVRNVSDALMQADGAPREWRARLLVPPLGTSTLSERTIDPSRPSILTIDAEVLADRLGRRAMPVPYFDVSDYLTDADYQLRIRQELQEAWLAASEELDNAAIQVHALRRRTRAGDMDAFDALTHAQVWESRAKKAIRELTTLLSRLDFDMTVTRGVRLPAFANTPTWVEAMYWPLDSTPRAAEGIARDVPSEPDETVTTNAGQRRAWFDRQIEYSRQRVRQLEEQILQLEREIASLDARIVGGSNIAEVLQRERAAKVQDKLQAKDAILARQEEIRRWEHVRDQPD